jgi:subtilisin family serine protease
MKQTHVILRSAGWARHDILAGPTLEAAGQVNLSVQIEPLEQRDLAELRRDTGVVAVAPAMPMRLIAPRDVHASLPAEVGDIAWGVAAVKASSSPFSGSGITVAVLDTGIEAGHAAFAGVELIRRNFTEDVDADAHGHGTHCAAIIFGRQVSGARIGVAPGIARALIGKVLGKGGGSSDQIVSAVQWAVDNGAHIVSMSLGIDFPGYARALQEKEDFPPELAVSWALEGYRQNVLLFERLASMLRMRSQPTLLVAAAGNESRSDIDPRFKIAVAPPAVAEGIVSVGALGKTAQGLAVASFSNTGAIVAAPGVGIVSAGLEGTLATMSGTSMATPHVAGAAALWAERILRSGPLGVQTLTARLVGSGTFDGLHPDFDAADVGAGLVTAPQS